VGSSGQVAGQQRPVFHHNYPTGIESLEYLCEIHYHASGPISRDAVPMGLPGVFVEGR
jgi:hypothetical protein